MEPLLNRLGEPLDTCETERGVARVWRPAPSLAVSTLTGHFQIEHANLIMETVDDAAEKSGGNAVVIHDWIGVKSFDIAVQVSMTKWWIRIVPSLSHVTIGVESPFIAAAVRTAGLASGGRFYVVSKGEQVEAAVVEALRT